jgi:sugar O-acyltransferase (sialic acid O-acetyltransferase NeuD family)
MIKKNDSVRNIVISGGSGFAREVAWLISDINLAAEPQWNVVGFWEGNDKESPSNKLINGIPLLGSDKLGKFLPDLYTVVAISSPRIRRRAVQQAADLGCKFATLIHPSVQYDQKTTIVGEGSIICAGSLLSVNVSIGSHVVVNWQCTIGHDTALHDFVTLSPGCHIAGNTHIMHDTLLGAGVVTVEKHMIGENSIVGAGSVVTKDIPSNATAFGIPAKVRKP